MATVSTPSIPRRIAKSVLAVALAVAAFWTVLVVVGRQAGPAEVQLLGLIVLVLLVVALFRINRRA